MAPEILTSNSRIHMKLSVGKCKISPDESARNIGVMFDKHMNIEHQVTSNCISTNYHVRNIGAIRHVLTESASTQLVHFLIAPS